MRDDPSGFYSISTPTLGAADELPPPAVKDEGDGASENPQEKASEGSGPSMSFTQEEEMEILVSFRSGDSCGRKKGWEAWTQDVARTLDPIPC